MVWEKNKVVFLILLLARCVAPLSYYNRIFLAWDVSWNYFTTVSYSLSRSLQRKNSLLAQVEDKEKESVLHPLAFFFNLLATFGKLLLFQLPGIRLKRIIVWDTEVDAGKVSMKGLLQQRPFLWTLDGDRAEKNMGSGWNLVCQHIC